MDSDSERQENQRVLAYKEDTTMMTTILVILFLFSLSIVGILCVVFLDLTIIKGDKEEWMDNSEFDYGHNVHHHNSDINY